MIPQKNIVKCFINFFIILLIIFVMLLVFTFVLLEYDVRQWSMFARLIFIIFCYAGILIYYIVESDVGDEKNKLN